MLVFCLLVFPSPFLKLFSTVSGFHRELLAGIEGLDRDSPYLTEIHATGKAGSVLILDSRLWNAVAPNRSDRPRVALIIRYTPWWLNLNPTMLGSTEHTSMVVKTRGKNYDTPPVRRDVYESLPDDVKPLYRHYVG